MQLVVDMTHRMEFAISIGNLLTVWQLNFIVCIRKSRYVEVCSRFFIFTLQIAASMGSMELKICEFPNIMKHMKKIKPFLKVVIRTFCVC